MLGFSFRVSMWQMWGIILLQIRMDINLWLRDGKEQKIKISQKSVKNNFEYIQYQIRFYQFNKGTTKYFVKLIKFNFYILICIIIHNRKK